MSTITATTPRPGIAATLAVHVGAWWKRRRRAAEIRAAAQALHRFDDRLLRDIGLSRADIDAGVQSGRPWK